MLVLLNQHPGWALIVWKYLCVIKNWFATCENKLKFFFIFFKLKSIEEWKVVEFQVFHNFVRADKNSKSNNDAILNNCEKNLGKFPFQSLLVSPHASIHPTAHFCRQWKCASWNWFNYRSLSNSLPRSRVNELQTSETRQVVLLCDN